MYQACRLYPTLKYASKNLKRLSWKNILFRNFLREMSILNEQGSCLMKKKKGL